MLAAILSLLLIQSDVIAQDTKLRTVENRAFMSGEVLEYRVHYGMIDAGVARLEVMPEKKSIGPREVFHVVGGGQTTGAFDWFFKVRDRYESCIESQALFPWLFLSRVDEGGHKINQDLARNHVKNIAVSKKATIATPKNITH